MIITKRKPIDELLRVLEKYTKLFLVGCGECATVCQTGGEVELAELKEILEEKGKTVVGMHVARTGCHMLEVKKDLRKMKELTGAADAFIGMGCGAGVQTLSQLFEKPVFVANDTLFLGNIQRFGEFSEHCSICGHCVLNETGGICPITRCPKGLLNGPCGGMDKGKCEVDRDKDCAWVLIYNKMKETGRLDEMKEINKPKDYSAGTKPKTRKIEVRRG